MSDKIKKIDLHQIIAANTAPYFNTVASEVNDHVVRMGIMTSAYAWHHHPNSDETFIGLQGVVIIETTEAIFDLHPGQVITIPRGVVHRTSPQSGQSANLTVEKADMETIFVEGR